MEYAVLLIIVAFICYSVASSKRRQRSVAPPPLWVADEKLPPNQWLIHVAGVTFCNHDGSSRQRIIMRCGMGERLQLIRDPRNRFSAKAIKICRMNGEQIGFVPDDWSRLAGELDRGDRFDAELFSMGQPEGNKRVVGVTVKITALATEQHESTADASAPPKKPSRSVSDLFPGRADIAANSSDWIISIAGEMQKNPDGSRRQNIIATCTVGEAVLFVRDQHDPRDANCVRVLRENGEQIGQLPKPWSRRIAPELDSGRSFEAEVFEIHGGIPGKPSRGVVIRVMSRLTAAAEVAR